jgi:signal transduction histidine kinase
MKPVRAPSRDLAEMYRQALKEYLAGGGETPLHQAYELGRQALDSGTGLLGLVSIHQEVTTALLREANGDALRQFRDAHHFLLESMAPFEMMQAGNRESNAALRRLNAILEEEAKRIAHILHDEAAQLLASVYLELAEILREVPPTPVRTHVERITSHLDQVREQLRRLSHELRPPILDQLGLMPALQFLADGFRKRTGLQVTIENVVVHEGRLPQLIETALYRAVQEALNNVTRHARAHNVRIRVWTEDRRVYCTVIDDGVGFSPSPVDMDAVPHGLGLLGIQERIASLHGSFKVNSAPGAGTELRIGIPIGSNL